MEHTQDKQNLSNAKLYLDLLEKVLTDFHRFEMGEFEPIAKIPWKGPLLSLARFADKAIKAVKPEISIGRLRKFNLEDRLEGKDWPIYADSMIGLKRMQNIRKCAEDVIARGVEGDFMETGVWRGGATIFMRAILRAYNVTDKIVWAADSFEGLPKPNEAKYEADKGDNHYTIGVLAVSLEEVQGNFRKYDLLDNQVKFLKGWFKDTMPTAPVEKLSLLRLDGDMYESTIDVLTHMYPKLVSGGYLIIDDFNLENCRQAVADYRRDHNITEPIEKIDVAGVYWKKN